MQVNETKSQLVGEVVEVAIDATERDDVADERACSQLAEEFLNKRGKVIRGWSGHRSVPIGADGNVLTGTQLVAGVRPTGYRALVKYAV